jgi:hypothetical protein
VSSFSLCVLGPSQGSCSSRHEDEDCIALQCSYPLGALQGAKGAQRVIDGSDSVGLVQV